MKIIGIYKITNTITGDFYIGSSKDVKRRWTEHKCPSSWKRLPNSPMYLDMQRYGVDKFVFQILAEVEESFLKKTEQQFIEKLKPIYNNYRANGFDFERKKERNREYKKSEKYKKYNKKYEKTEKRKKAKKEYQNQLCFYNGETLTLNALSIRFWKQGIINSTQEAKKYLLNKPKDNIKGE